MRHFFLLVFKMILEICFGEYIDFILSIFKVLSTPESNPIKWKTVLKTVIIQAKEDP